jgi:hypothetical protein
MAAYGKKTSLLFRLGLSALRFELVRKGSFCRRRNDLVSRNVRLQKKAGCDRQNIATSTFCVYAQVIGTVALRLALTQFSVSAKVQSLI